MRSFNPRTGRVTSLMRRLPGARKSTRDAQVVAAPLFVVIFVLIARVVFGLATLGPLGAGLPGITVFAVGLVADHQFLLVRLEIVHVDSPFSALARENEFIHAVDKGTAFFL